MKAPLFEGSGVAIVTPFKDEYVNYEKLGELIEFQIKNSTDCIVICGTTGESSTLSIPEHIACIEYCVKQVNGRTKVVAGTGSNDTAHAILLSQAAQDAGADGLLLVTPYYNKTTQAGLIKHYTVVAESVKLPIILYNVPSRTGMSFTAQTYYELSKVPNIIGCKEASGNFSLIAATRYLCGDDFNFWSGNDNEAVPIMSMGGKGVISVSANILPKETHDMCMFALNGDFKEAEKLQTRLHDVLDKLFIEVNPIPIKEAMNILGFDVGEPRLPLVPMSEKNIPALKAALATVGFNV